jgi:hypothetical protein
LFQCINLTIYQIADLCNFSKCTFAKLVREDTRRGWDKDKESEEDKDKGNGEGGRGKGEGGGGGTLTLESSSKSVSCRRVGLCGVGVRIRSREYVLFDSTPPDEARSAISVPTPGGDDDEGQEPGGVTETDPQPTDSTPLCSRPNSSIVSFVAILTKHTHTHTNTHTHTHQCQSSNLSIHSLFVFEFAIRRVCVCVVVGEVFRTLLTSTVDSRIDTPFFRLYILFFSLLVDFNMMNSIVMQLLALDVQLRIAGVGEGVFILILAFAISILVCFFGASAEQPG